MTGEKRSSDLSTRLGVKRAGKLATKASKSAANAVHPPPKAAISPAKAKKDEVQRRNNPFNAMIAQKHSKESDTGKEPASTTESQDVKEAGGSPSGNGENANDTSVLERLAELEKSQEIANEQQNTLKEELEKVRQHAQVYRETIEDYRRQLAEAYTQGRSPPRTFNDGVHSSLPSSTPELMEYEFENEKRRSVRVQNDDLIKQNYELRSRVAELEAQLHGKDAMYRGKPDPITLRTQEEWNQLTARVHTSEKESQERLEQLLSLKSSISSLTRVDSQVADSELSETFAQLANRVREWVISNFRRTKLDLSNVPTDIVKVLESISPNYESIDPTDRLALYQAFVSNTLMYIFREPIILGLPETGTLAETRQLAAYFNDTGSEYHEWRRATIRVLKKSKAKDDFEQEKGKLLQRLAANVAHQLSTLTSVTVSSSAHSALISIFNAAANIQDMLSLQKAQYNVHFFRIQEDKNVCWDEGRMESINDLDDVMDEDGVMYTDRKFAFCVFPCLEKFGNEWGENADIRNVLLKARVCCGVG